MLRIDYRPRAKGFTLVEIMIVVAIIALVAAIAIPNLLRARVSANETAGVGTLKMLVTALESFRAAQTPPTYPANLPLLSAENPPYAPAAITDGTHQGYSFTYAQSGANQYTLNANPVTANVTGVRGFFVDESGIIRVANPAPANANSPPLE